MIRHGSCSFGGLMLFFVLILYVHGRSYDDSKEGKQINQGGQTQIGLLTHLSGRSFCSFYLLFVFYIRFNRVTYSPCAFVHDRRGEHARVGGA
ncbi:hypothetical protein J3F83DRAFT_755293 [Trichoderma novae-zelandiae]